jgi:beta-glucuronidase
MVTAGEKPSSAELIAKAWEVHGNKDIKETFKYTQQVIDLYKEEADKQQASLTAMPKDIDIDFFRALNDVATAYFIQGESYRDQGNIDEALKAFKTVMYKYCYAQAWDQRGWRWKVAKTAFESVVKLKPGEAFAPCPCAGISYHCPKKTTVSQLPTKIILYDPGKEEFVDYQKYGEFKNVGTKDYRYQIKDQEGLMAAVGEGIYPNTTSVRWDPEFKKAKKDKRLEGDHWDFVQSPDLEAAFLKWATCSEPQGVRLYYIGLILEKSGLIKQALKCYYAIVINFPGAYGWTYWHTPWYVGQAAIAKINFLLRRNPQLNYKLEGADIKIVNGFDNDVSNDIVITNPGKFVKVGLMDKFKTTKPDKEFLSIKKRLGKGKVHLVQYETGDWELLVDGTPYIIKGITYAPTKVGQSPDNGTLANWSEEDENKNGKADGPYDAFVDKNKNNIQDRDESAVGDFKLMQDMGVNTIRIYHQPHKPNKEVLRDLYHTYGIRVIMGDFLGKYALGSGASWDPGTDYNNPEHKKNMLESVAAMVNEHKDEPYLLLWLLGNENVYGYACNADKDPEAFFKFANEAALLIKSLDKEHPVAICSGDILFLDRFGKFAPGVDIFGANAYRGNFGFGRFWRNVKEEAGRPAFITEFGCGAYAEGKNLEDAQVLQADYHQGSWEDIRLNLGFGKGQGNSIGGVAYEWLDEWWKAYEPAIHDTKGLWKGPFADGYMHEEWLGLNSQGNGKLSPFLRQPRQSYYKYKELWK